MEKWEEEKVKDWEKDMLELKKIMNKLAKYVEVSESDGENSSNDVTPRSNGSTPRSTNSTPRNEQTSNTEVLPNSGETNNTTTTSPTATTTHKTLEYFKLDSNTNLNDKRSSLKMNHSLIPKKIKDSKKKFRSLKKIKKSIFEMTLSEIYESEKNYSGYDNAHSNLQTRVPLLLIRLIKLVEINGGEEQEGIFRLSPSLIISEKFKSLILKKSETKSVKKYESLKCDDPHLAASTLKQWLAGLPESIFPDYNTCLESVEDPEKILGVAKSLSSINGRSLYYLLKFLRAISENEKTKMSLNALSLVWAPALLRSPTEVDYFVAAKNSVLEGKFICTLFEKHPNHLIGFGAVGANVKATDKKSHAVITDYSVAEDKYLLKFDDKKTEWFSEKDIIWQKATTTVDREIYLSQFLEEGD